MHMKYYMYIQYRYDITLCAVGFLCALDSREFLRSVRGNSSWRS